MQTFLVSGRVAVAKQAALGDVCIHFSIFEFKIEQTIWALRGHSRKIGRLNTRRTLFRQRIAALRTEAKKRFGLTSAEYKWFDTFASQAESLAKDRNFFVHGVWCKGNFTGGRRTTYALSYFDKPSGQAQETTALGLQLLRFNIVKMTELLDQQVPHFLGAPLP